MSSVPWQVLIVEMVKAKQALHDVDTGGVFEYHLPRLACTEEQLRAVEAAIDEPLDPLYRDFLSHAGGWRWFSLEVHLFRPEELCGGPAMDYALEMLRFADLSEAGCTLTDLLPIASGPNNTDVFSIGRKGTVVEGRVLWIAGGLIDAYEDFEEYFASMIAYTRLDVEAFAANARKR